MKSSFLTTTAAMAVLFVLAGPVSAEVPFVLSYQGYLTDSVGNPVTGDWTVTFGLFHDANGGEAFHIETIDLTTQLGLFNAPLGADPDNLLDHTQLADGEAYLEITIETDVGPVVLDPRQKVISNPFSFYAQTALDADMLGGETVDSFVTVAQIPEVCITPDTLEAALEELGFSPSGTYGDDDVAGYLVENGFNPCACYGEDDVAAFLLAAGYVPGPHFSGSYEDLIGAPDAAGLISEDNLLDFLLQHAVLFADGSVALTSDLNFGGFEALNLRVHNSDLPPEDPQQGQLWWSSADKLLRVYNGDVWALISQGSAADVSCQGCVDSDDVAFGYAAASEKGGAALESLNLDCIDCVDAAEVSFSWAKGTLPGGDALNALSADTATDLNCAACVQVGEIDPAAMNGNYVAYDPAESGLGVNNVQKAIDALAAGGTGGDFQEGNGTIVPYVEQWGLPAYGEATTYIHLMNPSTPKVMMYLYAGESSGFSTSNNLVVAYDFAPNQYTADVSGNQGESALQVGNPSVFNIASHVLIHQTIGTGGNGQGAGNWELNQVLSVQGATLQLVKPLQHTYTTCGNDCGRAQAVVAASYNQLEIVNGGTLKAATELDGQGQIGGIIYVRAQKIVVKSGGKITADGAGFLGGGNTSSSCEWMCGQRGDSQCHTDLSAASTSANCTGGGAAKVNTCAWQGGSYCNNKASGGGGGGNKTEGEAGSTGWNNWTGGGAGGGTTANGETKLHFGGGGGGAYPNWCDNARGGDGGGIIVLGAATIIVEKGGNITADGLMGTPTNFETCNASQSFPMAGSGAGGTVKLYADEFIIDGTVTAGGGPHHQGNHGTFGGAGGEGYVVEGPTISGVVNESYAKGVEVWLDGNNVTEQVGDPNDKGAPAWDADEQKWGADGLEEWSTGPLDLTSTVPWSLGEHRIQLRETGGAGGDVKMFTYVIYPFTNSKPPVNDTCDQPIMLDVMNGPKVVSGTTEDIMGKTKATDASQGPFCGGGGGPDVTYGFVLDDWRQLTVDVQTAFTPRTYIKKEACLDGAVVACGQEQLVTNVFEPGTYYLFVDGDGNLQKGNFKLTVASAPPGPPANDVCAKAEPLVFDAGTAKAEGMTLFATNKAQAACGGADAPETVYTFNVPQNTTKLNVAVDADFEPVIYLVKEDCGAAPIACIPLGSYNMDWPTAGKYYLFVDGKTVTDKGLFSLTVKVE